MQNNLGVALHDNEWFGLDNKSDKNQFSITILVDSNFHDTSTYQPYNRRFVIQFWILIKESYQVEPSFEKLQGIW